MPRQATVRNPVPEPTPIGKFLAWVKPYRELIALVVVVGTSVSAAIAWVVAHFATQAELSFLECRMYNKVQTQLLPARLGEFAAKLDWRTAQIRLLVNQSPQDPEVSSAIAELTDDITKLTQQQQADTKEFQDQMDALAALCNKLNPEPPAGD